jgi:hypothetical protein
MKNFLAGFAIEIVVIINTISGFVTGLCLVGLFLAVDKDVLLILGFSLPIFIISVVYLRSKKITSEEFLGCLWPFSLPW